METGKTGVFTREQAIEALRNFSQKGEKSAGKPGVYKKGGFLGLGGYKQINENEAFDRLSKGDSVYTYKTPQDVREVGNLQDLQLLDTIKGARVNPVVTEGEANALEFLERGADSNDGIYDKGFMGREKKLDAIETLKVFQKESKVLNVKLGNDDDNPVAGTRDMEELNALQGQGVNTILPQPEFDAFKTFEPQGFYLGTGEKGKAYDALQVLQAGQSVQVDSKGRRATVSEPHDLQELDSLEKKGQNTILPQEQYDALKLFEKNAESQKQTPYQTGGQKGFAYEALQGYQAGKAVDVFSKGRLARTNNITDLLELEALEGEGKNLSMLPQDTVSLLKGFESSGEQGGQSAFMVDGKPGRAYEALQALQAGKPFSVRSYGRYAPVSNLDDLKLLEAFEGPGQYSSLLPQDVTGLLRYFESTNEQQGSRGFKVDGKEGRAYEAYAAMRKGQAFQAKAGGAWNSVLTKEDLVELNALLGNGANTILPDDQFAVLKNFSDGTYQGITLTSGGSRTNSYGALQKLQAGERVSFQLNGGDFGDVLQVPVNRLEDLPQALALCRNQQDYDKYRWSVPEFKDKVSPYVNQTPLLVQKALQQAAQEVRGISSPVSDGMKNAQKTQQCLQTASSSTKDILQTIDQALAFERPVQQALNEAQGPPQMVYGHVKQAQSYVERAVQQSHSVEQYLNDAEKSMGGSSSGGGHVHGHYSYTPVPTEDEAKQNEHDGHSSHNTSSNPYHSYTPVPSGTTTETPVEHDDHSRHGSGGYTPVPTTPTGQDHGSHNSHGSHGSGGYTPVPTTPITPTPPPEPVGPDYSAAKREVDQAQQGMETAHGHMHNALGKLGNVESHLYQAAGNLQQAQGALNQTVREMARASGDVRDLGQAIDRAGTASDTPIDALQSALQGASRFEAAVSQIVASFADKSPVIIESEIVQVLNISKDVRNQLSQAQKGNSDVKGGINGAQGEVRDTAASVGNALNGAKGVAGNIGQALETAKLSRGCATDAGNCSEAATNSVHNVEGDVRSAQDAVRRAGGDSGIISKLECTFRETRDIHQNLHEVGESMNKVDHCINGMGGTISNAAGAIDRMGSVLGQASSSLNGAGNGIQQAADSAGKTDQKISEALARLDKAEAILSRIPTMLKEVQKLQQAYESLSEGTFSQDAPVMKGSLKAIAELGDDEMKALAARALKLISVMETRPPRPSGWTAPSPLIQK